MTDAIREKCELLALNRADIRKHFLFENSLMSIVAGLIFTSAGKEADIDKMKSCRKLLNRKTRLLSNLRDIVELALLSKMALSDSPEQYLEDLISVYAKVQKGKFLENDYMVMASIVILDHQLQNESDEIVSKANELMKRMNSDHPILTAVDDTSFIFFLAIAGKSVDTILADLEESYNYITSTYKTTLGSDPVYELCEVLAVTFGDMKDKCDKVMRIYNSLVKTDFEYGTGSAFSALGAFAGIDVEPGFIAEEISSTEKYLKTMKGFSEPSVDKKTRIMCAAVIVADVYGSIPEAAGNSMISNTLSLIWVKKISNMISVISSVAPGLISAVLPEENKDKGSDPVN